MSNRPVNGTVLLDGIPMDYIAFGSGRNPLIMIPGLGDGLHGVKGLALPFSVLYRKYGAHYRVYLFSRKHQLSPDCTTRDMAEDIARAMDILKIPQADVIGVSQGGMIAQHLAADYPDKVRKLVLTVTAGRWDPHVAKSLLRWRELAAAGKHQALMMDTLETMYSPRRIKQGRWTTPAVSLFTRPGSYERFIIMADASINHDCYDKLTKIQAPTLVIGGEQDKVVSPEASRDLAARIPNAQLHIYREWGHGLYEEAPDYNARVLEFLKT